MYINVTFDSPFHPLRQSSEEWSGLLRLQHELQSLHVNGISVKAKLKFDQGGNEHPPIMGFAGNIIVEYWHTQSGRATCLDNTWPLLTYFIQVNVQRWHTMWCGSAWCRASTTTGVSWIIWRRFFNIYAEILRFWSFTSFNNLTFLYC